MRGNRDHWTHWVSFRSKNQEKETLEMLCRVGAFCIHLSGVDAGVDMHSKAILLCTRADRTQIHKGPWLKVPVSQGQNVPRTGKKT